MVDWAERADEAWQALIAATRSPGLRGPRIHEPGRIAMVAAWPMSQVLHAATLLAAAGVPTRAYGPDQVWRSLRRFRKADGFADSALGGTRYFDDNAWIGLACAQRALLADGETAVGETSAVGNADGALPAGRATAGGTTAGGASAGETRSVWARRARASLKFVSQGVRRDGGVLWVEGGSDLNACSTGSTGLLAAAVGHLDGRRYPLADAAGEFLDHELGDAAGLIADRVSPSGEVDPSVFTYNQGLAIQLRIERGLLRPAEALAESVQDHFGETGFWRHALAFNAIYLRALLRLDALTGTGRWQDVVTQYTDRLWRDARDQRGLISGAGRYDSGFVLDHAAAVGVMAGLALPIESQRLVL